jgi:hypothetical protein
VGLAFQNLRLRIPFVHILEAVQISQTEVRAQGGETILILEGDVAVATSQVTALRDPAA